jgi:hypothetical protein
MATYRHEQQRRDADGSGGVDEQEFVASHGPVLAAFRYFPGQARAFIERAAGGFFDVLDSMATAASSWGILRPMRWLTPSPQQALPPTSCACSMV